MCDFLFCSACLHTCVHRVVHSQGVDEDGAGKASVFKAKSLDFGKLAFTLHCCSFSFNFLVVVFHLLRLLFEAQSGRKAELGTTWFVFVCLYYCFESTVCFCVGQARAVHVVLASLMSFIQSMHACALFGISFFGGFRLILSSSFSSSFVVVVMLLVLLLS